MKKYNGCFLYYIDKNLKQYCFKGATEKQVTDWYVIFSGSGYRLLKVDAIETDKNTPFHLGW